MDEKRAGQSVSLRVDVCPLPDGRVGVHLKMAEPDSLGVIAVHGTSFFDYDSPDGRSTHQAESALYLGVDSGALVPLFLLEKINPDTRLFSQDFGRLIERVLNEILTAAPKDAKLREAILAKLNAPQETSHDEQRIGHEPGNGSDNRSG